MELARLVRRQLELLGEDPDREGLARTPERVAKSLAWLTRGYDLDARDVIGDAIFEETHENMVMVRDIELYSLCEHHMLPFFGKAHVAYIPNGQIVGLSKLPRIVDVFARRLQVQERLTEQIAQRHRGRAGAEGRRRRHRGVPPLHDDARRREAELEDDHQRVARRVPGVSDDAQRVSQTRASELLIRATNCGPYYGPYYGPNYGPGCGSYGGLPGPLSGPLSGPPFGPTFAVR